VQLVASACLAAGMLAACTSNHPAPTAQGSGSSTSPSPGASSPTAAASVSSAGGAGGSSPTGAASAAPTQLPAASGSTASTGPTGLPVPGPNGPLAIFADVPIKAAFSTAQTGLVAAEGPDGAVFVAGVATQPAQPQVIWVVDGVQPAAVAEHVTGPVTALAADTANLYVGIASSVYAYSRTTGALVHSWSPTASTGSGTQVTQVTQLAIAGDRLWGLLTSSDNGPTAVAGSLVEIDPTSTSIVRTISGITGAFSFAPGSAGVYYVTKQSTALVEQTNNGATASAPTHQAVNLELSGPSAIQAVAVVGDQVVLQHDAGQGLDAVLNTYDAGSLAGPSPSISFSAAEQLVSTPSGLFVIGNPDTGACAAGQQICVRRFSLSGGNVGASLALPDDTLATTLTGPYPSVVLGAGSDLHVLRIS
jgi:hypothetical protein